MNETYIIESPVAHSQTNFVKAPSLENLPLSIKK